VKSDPAAARLTGVRDDKAALLLNPSAGRVPETVRRFGPATGDYDLPQKTTEVAWGELLSSITPLPEQREKQKERYPSPSWGVIKSDKNVPRGLED